MTKLSPSTALRTLVSFSLSLLSFACNEAPSSSQMKIVGGERVETAKDQRITPSVVKLKYYDPSAEGKQEVCTGFLIGPTHIVTAAHCLLGKEDLGLTISYGVDGSESIYYPLPIKARTPHPLWNFENISVKYDIGLISLKVPLDTNHHDPKPWSTLEIFDFEDLKNGDEVMMAGYGKLHHAPDAPNEVLYQVKEKIALLNRETRSFAIQHGKGVGGCHGDSGGPITLDQDGKLRVAGIMHGEGKDANGESLEGLSCDVGFGTFAAISLYQGWMKCTFEAHGNPLPGLKEDESSEECVLNRF